MKTKKYEINSLLDTDFYKLTMGKMIFHQFPSAVVEFKFHCRNKDINFRPVVEEIQNQIGHLCELKYTKDELEYLRTIPFLSRDYIDILRIMQLSSEDINVFINDDNQLNIITNGNWFLTSPFEVPVLAIVNKCYFDQFEWNETDADEQLTQKIQLCNSNPLLRFSEFGTRRRRSHAWQQHVLQRLKNELKFNQLTGTSNVFFAKEQKIKYSGTMAHEIFMASQGLKYRLVDSQHEMLKAWAKEYEGCLGIALTDTIGIDAFLKDFTLDLAKLYDGTRCDSGDPYSYGEKIINHYQKLNIDPMSKSIIFSDSLNFSKVIDIMNYFQGRIKVAFGIGTNLTNDNPNRKPLNIVMKMTKCNNQPVAKISDTKGKGICQTDDYVNYLQSVFDKKPTLY